MNSIRVSSVSLLIALAGLVPIIPGCATRGSVEGRVHGTVMGQNYDFKGKVEWGEPVSDLPTGSTLAGYATVNGVKVKVFIAPDGTVYIQTPGSDNYNPWEGARWENGRLIIPVTGSTAPNGGQQQQRSSDFDIQAFLDIDDEGTDPNELGLDYLSYVLPPGAVFHDPDKGDFEVTAWTAKQLDDGSLHVEIWGPDNEVLGAAMEQGIMTLRQNVPGFGMVTGRFDHRSSSYVFLDASGRPVPAEFKPLRLLYTGR